MTLHTARNGKKTTVESRVIGNIIGNNCHLPSASGQTSQKITVLLGEKLAS